MLAQKRALDTLEAERQQKRMLFNTLMQQSAMQMSLGGFQPNSISSSSSSVEPSNNNGFNPNSLLMQSLQQNGQQPIFFGGGNMNAQMMNFGNNFNMGPSNNHSNMNNSNGDNCNAMNGLKPFEIFAAQQQQNTNVANAGNNFNPLLSFHLPTSNNSLMNTMAMNGSINNMGIGSSMNGGCGGGDGHQNPSSTVEIVNAAIHALKGAP
jgi:hypothetical protein